MKIHPSSRRRLLGCLVSTLFACSGGEVDAITSARLEEVGAHVPTHELPELDTSSPMGKLLEAQLREADAVVQGRVERIEHRILTDAKGIAWPYTFVTYQVLRGIKGGVEGEALTLRVVGGPSPDGREVVAASHVPLFNVGNTDLLFVRRNGAWWCPLVRSERGLLRVVDGRVYTEDGHAMLLEGGRVGLGGRAEFAEARTSYFKGQALELRRVSVPARQETNTEGADVQTFVALLERAAAAMPRPVAQVSALSVGPDAPLQLPLAIP